MVLSKKRVTKALTRLRRCAGWSAPVLFAKTHRQVFSHRGPFYNLNQYSFYFQKEIIVLKQKQQENVEFGSSFASEESGHPAILRLSSDGKLAYCTYP